MSVFQNNVEVPQNKCQGKSRKFTWNKWKYKNKRKVLFPSLDVYCSEYIVQLTENIDYFISVELALKWALLEAGHSSITRVMLFKKAVDTAIASCYSFQNMNIPLEC